MKLTDFALIFVAVLLPIVVITFVNTSFVVKSEKQEMYYKNLMNSAVIDAVSSMKHIENEDDEIDYGYSGIVDKKVSINADVAINTFYNSFANNFNIANNEVSLERLKMHIPAIAVLDYDGIYIHSAEENQDKEITFITKPKTYYTYNYVITTNALKTTDKTEFWIKQIKDIEDLKGETLLNTYIYEITFTMDDYVYLSIYRLVDDYTNIRNEIELTNKFYLTDYKNNGNLVYADTSIPGGTNGETRKKLIKEVVEHLQSVRKQVIAETAMKEISYAINKHNSFAKQTGINYNFKFTVESDEVWYETIDGIGMIAFIQGVSLGNRYLNYKAYSASDLVMTQRYYVSKGVTIEGKDMSYLGKDLYHISNKCLAYLEYANNTKDKVVPSYYLKKAEAATNGYYPCPICKP